MRSTRIQKLTVAGILTAVAVVGSFFRFMAANLSFTQFVT